jgi:hypothetical protein
VTEAPRLWTPQPFLDDNGTFPFERFLDSLSDVQVAALEAAIDRVLTVRGLDLAGTEWLKALGEGLHEFRIRHDATEISRMFVSRELRPSKEAEAILLRLHVHFFGDRRVLLLNGYDKGRDPSRRRQQREIARARRLLAQFKQRK